MKIDFLRAAAVITVVAAALAGSAGARAQSRNATVSGYITDSKTGETLLSAGVSTGTGADFTGAVTNSYGFYTLTVPKGQRELTYSYVGYSDQTISIDLQRDTTINITLNPDL
ncbi:MAG: carboxypeptidase-like regulatory domain-containing protein, partial [Bacteroidales bacterium]|nr:carboxypeptidase-like regulatory domain-containing protein [Bacteroidales bacterium]